MNLVVNFIRHIFVPAIYLLFIMAGLICALVSGYIELEVFHDLFLPEYYNNSGTIGFVVVIPFLIVLTFETTKLFLVFFQKKKQEQTILSKNLLNGVRKFLIGVSILSTLIFSFNRLNNVREQTETANARIEENYLAERDSLLGRFDWETKELLAPYKNRLAEINQLIEEEKENKGANGVYFGPQYTKLLNQQGVATEKLNMERKKRNKLRIDLLAKLENEKKEQLESVAINRTSDITLQNPSLTNLLTIIWELFTPNNKFSKEAYVALIVILSLVISIGLELIIYVSFSILAISPEEIIKFPVEDSELSATQSKRYETYLISLCGGIIFTLIILIARILRTGEADQGRGALFFIAFTVCLFLVGGMANLLKMALKGLNKESPPSDLGKKIAFAAVTTGFTFIGYVIVGIIFNGNTDLDSVEKIAIVIGSGIVSSLIGDFIATPMLE